MTLQRPINNRGSGTKRALGVQALLEWAFRIEKAQLELPGPKDVIDERFGLVWNLSCCRGLRWAAKWMAASTRWAVTPMRMPK